MTEDSIKMVKYKVQRFDPEKDKDTYFQEFMVPVKHGMTVLEGLLYIKENLDSTLAFRTSCRMGICGSCAMIVNDYPHLACHTQIEEFNSDKLTVKPLPNMPIIKDLVPELDTLFERHKSIMPYIINSDSDEMENPTGEFSQMPEELNKFLQFTYCIKCGICISACPTSASDKLFLGPQALSQCFRYCADGRDEGQDERLPLVDADHGAWRCHFAGACSEACPKGLDPGLAVQLLKRRLVSKAIGVGKKRQSPQVIKPPEQTKEKVPYPEFTIKDK